MALTASNTAESNLKRRRTFTDLERRNIRQRYTEHPGPQPALISWFVAETLWQKSALEESKARLQASLYLNKVIELGIASKKCHLYTRNFLIFRSRVFNIRITSLIRIYSLVPIVFLYPGLTVVPFTARICDYGSQESRANII
jgi:hypothetical protein